MAKDKTKAAASVSDPKPGKPEAKCSISTAEAAKLAKIDESDVFAVNEYADRFHVITTDGRKVVLEK